MQRTEWTLGELADASGTSARTIRFYIARGLLPAPVTAGRNARYDRSHLERLNQIGALKKSGLTLTEIGMHLEDDEGKTPGALPEPVPLHGMALSGDVQVLVRAGLPPWRMKQIRRILAETARQLENLTKSEN